jgi:D-3-phosphoglycerate dehydrogenase
MTVTYISDPVHPAVLEDLAQLGRAHLGFGTTAVTYDEVRDETDAVLLRAERFDAAKITDSPRLRIIARHGVGTDNVDIDAASAAGVWVTITPGSNSRAVAEHVFALVLAVARRVPYGAAATSAGRWTEPKPHMIGRELHEATLGLVGFGSIARLVSQIAQGFGMDVLTYDPYVSDQDVVSQGTRPADLQTVLAGSDVLSLHLPLTPDTRHLLDAAAIDQMKPDAILVNTSRGELIDEGALASALQSGHLGGAGLDVLGGESIDPADPLAHCALPLRELPNVVVTPHVAGQTDQAFLNAGQLAVASIKQVLAGGVPDHAVNQVNAVEQVPV